MLTFCRIFTFLIHCLGQLFHYQKANDKCLSANFQKNLSPSHITCRLRVQRPEANSIDLAEVAHDEPPHQDLYCLQIQLIFVSGS